MIVDQRQRVLRGRSQAAPAQPGTRPAQMPGRALAPTRVRKQGWPQNYSPAVGLICALTLALGSCGDSAGEGQGGSQAMAGQGLALPELGAADTLQIPASTGDLIFVSIDTLRADHLPFYGYSKATAGQSDDAFSLAWLADQGVVYEQTWAPIGKTLPSLASVWTGAFPLEHGAISNPTPLGLPTFAQAFQGAGYATHAFVANRALSPGCGLERGFDEYEIYAKSREAEIPAQAVRSASQTIEAGRPLLLWAHFMAPHQPYAPSAELARSMGGSTGLEQGLVADNETLYQFHRRPGRLTPEQKQQIIALYDGEIAQASLWVQELLQGLDEAYRAAGRGPLLEAATVVFFSDHGEELAERHGYFLHAKSLYSGVLRVPMVIAGKGRAPSRESRPTTLMHVLPLALGAELPEPTYWYASWQQQFYAIRDSRWTLVHNPGLNRDGPYEPPTDAEYLYEGVELYDRTIDPSERVDVAQSKPEQVARMLGELSRWYAELEQREAQFLPGTDPHLKMKQLHELGYIDVVPKQVEVPWTRQRLDEWRND